MPDGELAPLTPDTPWPDRAHHVRIGLIGSLGGLAAWYYLPLLVEEGARLLGHASTLASIDSAVLRLGVQLAVMFGLLIWAMLVRRVEPGALGFEPPSLRRDAKLLLVLGGTAGGLFSLLALALLWLAGEQPKWFGGAPGQSPPLVLVGTFGFREIDLFTVISIVFAYPIMEEVMFRGWLYPAIRRGFGAAAAIGVSAVLFAFAHNVSLPVSQLIGGIVFTFAYERRGSLASPIILHMLGNGGLVAYSWWVLSETGPQ